LSLEGNHPEAAPSHLEEAVEPLFLEEVVEQLHQVAAQEQLLVEAANLVPAHIPQGVVKQQLLEDLEAAAQCQEVVPVLQQGE